MTTVLRESPVSGIKLTFTNVSEPLCPCLVLPESFTEALATMMDMSLLKNPVFLLIGISNVFGMAGLYVPFVYLVDAAKLDVSKEDERFCSGVWQIKL